MTVKKHTDVIVDHVAKALPDLTEEGIDATIKDYKEHQRITYKEHRAKARAQRKQFKQNLLLALDPALRKTRRKARNTNEHENNTFTVESWVECDVNTCYEAMKSRGISLRSIQQYASNFSRDYPLAAIKARIVWKMLKRDKVQDRIDKEIDYLNDLLKDYKGIV